MYNYKECSCLPHFSFLSPISLSQPAILWQAFPFLWVEKCVLPPVPPPPPPYLLNRTSCQRSPWKLILKCLLSRLYQLQYLIGAPNTGWLHRKWLFSHTLDARAIHNTCLCESKRITPSWTPHLFKYRRPPWIWSPPNQNEAVDG